MFFSPCSLITFTSRIPGKSRSIKISLSSVNLLRNRLIENIELLCETTRHDFTIRLLNKLVFLGLFQVEIPALNCS